MNNEEILQDILAGNGVGSQLWKIFSRLGIKHYPECSCLLLADLMNELGPEGCRYNHEKILKLLKKNQKKYGWSSYLKAGANAVVTGWIFKLNPLDPLPGLLEKAISIVEQDKCRLCGPTE